MYQDLIYVFSCEDDEGVDKAMIGNWFTKVAIPIEEAELSGGNNVKISNND